MRIHWLRCGVVLVLAALVLLTGCRKANKGGDPQGPALDTSTHLGTQTDISLSDWLGQPREKLAELVAEASETARAQRQAARDNPKVIKLLPRLQPPLVV